MRHAPHRCWEIGKTQDAVVPNLEIMGEAAKHMSAALWFWGSYSPWVEEPFTM